jgi:RNA polymerase sigma-70 factor, ECF subfamily
MEWEWGEQPWRFFRRKLNVDFELMTITKEILLDFVNGQKAAFDSIYAAYAPGMFGICLRYTRCKDDAQDILQETFIKVYEKREMYNPELPFGAWVKTIAIRSALNYIKQNYRFVLSDNESHFDAPIEDGGEHEELMSDYKSRLLQILQQLPDGYRMVFNLYTIDNLTHKEIAEYLNVSEGTSKSQYFKAKKMIQEMLETEKVER